MHQTNFFSVLLGNKMQYFALRHQLKFPFWIIKLMLFRISHFTCFRNSLILLFILWIFAVSVNVSSNNGLDLEFCTKFRGIFAVLPIPHVDPYPTHGQKHRHDTLPLHRARLLSAQMLKGYIYIHIYIYDNHMAQREIISVKPCTSNKPSTSSAAESVEPTPSS